jgi:hypothetical protein
MDPATGSEIANSPVVSEIERLLSAALTWNSRMNSGIRGCTQYKSANVENPAANNARFVRRNSAVPFSI